MNMDCMYTSLSDSISIMYSVGVYIYICIETHVYILCSNTHRPQGLHKPKYQLDCIVKHVLGVEQYNEAAGFCSRFRVQALGLTKIINK